MIIFQLACYLYYVQKKVILAQKIAQIAKQVQKLVLIIFWLNIF